MRATPATIVATDGILAIDKPAGVSSHDVIRVARRAVGVRRIGHAGTLDPFATGLLLLLIGRATRLLPYIDSEPKEYDARIVFGTETDTDDLTGAPVRSGQPPLESAVISAVPFLTGQLSQVPPAYSAKQIGGVRAYRAARRGRQLDLAPTPVLVHAWTAIHYADGVLTAQISCAGGTYIRALARDLGRLCGSAAHLAALRRVRLGRFHSEAALPLTEIDQWQQHILPPLSGIGPLERVRVSGEEELLLTRGVKIPAASESARAAMVSEDGRLVAIAEREGEVWQPRVVLTDV